MGGQQKALISHQVIEGKKVLYDAKNLRKALWAIIRIENRRLLQDRGIL